MSKLSVLLIASVLLTGACVQAEDSDQAVVVPLHDPARPPMVHAHLMTGGIRVRGEDRKDIAVETSGHERERRPERSDGMHRIDTGGGGLDIREENNVVTIKTDVFHGGGDVTILVPRHASLELKSLSGGEISVENVEGDIEVENLNGAIRLKDVGGSVVAHSLNGEVTADLKSVDPSKPMSFSTMNGKIDVTLPADVKASVAMKTDNGEILSDFDVKLDGSAKVTDSGGGRQSDGTYHVHLDKTLHGTINGGGPEYKFRSFNGQILIRKRK
jgi:DUF4097 and DUF4098 domain-containing protein YvlB